MWISQMWFVDLPLPDNSIFQTGINLIYPSTLKTIWNEPTFVTCSNQTQPEHSYRRASTVQELAGICLHCRLSVLVTPILGILWTTLSDLEPSIIVYWASICFWFEIWRHNIKVDMETLTLVKRHAFSVHYWESTISVALVKSKMVNNISLESGRMYGWSR